MLTEKDLIKDFLNSPLSEEFTTSQVIIVSSYINKAYAMGYNLHFGKRFSSKPRPIRQLNQYGRLIKEWPSIQAAAEALNLCPSNIVRSCKGKKGSLGGYYWGYI